MRLKKPQRIHCVVNSLLLIHVHLLYIVYKYPINTQRQSMESFVVVSSYRDFKKIVFTLKVLQIKFYFGR